MLTETDINLAVPQPLLNAWLVRCSIFPDLEAAAIACQGLEQLTGGEELALADFPGAGRLVTRSLAQVTDEGTHITITPVGLAFYASCQAWMRVHRTNHPEAWGEPHGVS
jgi:hypothetical protein